MYYTTNVVHLHNSASGAETQICMSMGLTIDVLNIDFNVDTENAS